MIWTLRLLNALSRKVRVMAAIPLGFTGAVIGLQLLDLNLGIMAIMGLFTLTGVIVNDSIILITAFFFVDITIAHPVWMVVFLVLTCISFSYTIVINSA